MICPNCRFTFYPPPPQFPVPMAYPPPQMPPCVNGDGCWRKNCMYAHPSAGAPSTSASVFSSGPVCLAFMTGTCKFGEKCRHRHDATEDDIERLRATFAETPCKHGLACKNEQCMFKHNQTTAHNPYN